MILQDLTALPPYLQSMASIPLKIPGFLGGILKSRLHVDCATSHCDSLLLYSNIAQAFDYNNTEVAPILLTSIIFRCSQNLMAISTPRAPEPSMLLDRREEYRSAVAFALFVVVDTPTSVSDTHMPVISRDTPCLVFKFISCRFNESHQIINQVLEANIDKAYGETYLWLADPDLFPTLWAGPAGTVPPVPQDWRSRFLGTTTPGCYEYLLDDHPRLPFFIDRYRFVVLDDTLKQ